MSGRDGWQQGIYKCQYPDKYIGNKPPTYRSSWEYRCFYFADNNINIIKWASELIIIPYFSVVDNKTHKYITDMYMEIRQKDGQIKKYVVEIKPESQHYKNPPKPPKRKTSKSLANYNHILETQKINECKWKAAEAFCHKYGYEFKIITEKDIF